MWFVAGFEVPPGRGKRRAFRRELDEAVLGPHGMREKGVLNRWLAWSFTRNQTALEFAGQLGCDLGLFSWPERLRHAMKAEASTANGKSQYLQE